MHQQAAAELQHISTIGNKGDMRRSPLHCYKRKGPYSVRTAYTLANGSIWKWELCVAGRISVTLFSPPLLLLLLLPAGC